MDHNFYILVTFLVNICPKPLRDLFVRLAEADTGHTYMTLNAYLQYRKGDIDRLKQRRVLKTYQYNLVWNSQGLDAWDITLLTTLLKEMFPKSASQYVSELDAIRDVRNALQHLSGTANLSESDFSRLWAILEKSTISLAPSGNRSDLQRDIDTIKTSYITNIGDVLRSWYTDKILQLEDLINDLNAEVTELKSQVNGVKEDTNITRKILTKGTVKRSRTGGGKFCKRFKAIDKILEYMRDTFATTVKQHLPKEYEPPEEIKIKIRSELEENHFVIVSGFGNSLYLPAALYAIKEHNYGQACAEVRQPSDWKHISYEEISLALFVHPFGQNDYEHDKANEMFDILNSIKDATTADDREKIDVVVVTDQSVLNQFIQSHNHELLETVVTVYKPTTENTPVDIDTGYRRHHDEEYDQNYKSLSVRSHCYFREKNLLYTDENCLSGARDMFKSKKVIVISGPRECGKTTLALTLIRSYQEGHYLILTDPEELIHVKYGLTCVIVIEDLGGKYFYDKVIAQKWLQKFDTVYPAVKQGKLNVIITCGADRLDTIRKDIFSHPMLEHGLTLPNYGAVRIKQELEHSASGYPSTVKKRSPGRTRFTGCTHNVVWEDILDGRNHDFFDSPLFCQSKDGFYILWKDFGSGSYCFDYYDSNFQLKHTITSDYHDDWSYLPKGICTTEDGNLLVLFFDRIEMYTIGDTLTRRKSVDLNTVYDRIFEDGNIILVTSTKGEIWQFDTNLNLKKRYKATKIFRNVDDLSSYFAFLVHGGCLMVGNIKNEIYVIDCHTRQFKSRKIDFIDISSVCRFDEDSFLVLGTSRMYETRILHLNLELDIMSDVTVYNLSPLYSLERILYDKTKHRILILYGNVGYFKISELVLK